MSRCECPLEDDEIQTLRKKHKSSRDIVLMQLRSTGNQKRKRSFKAFLQECKFGLVRDTFLELGAVDVNYTSNWVVAWMDGVIPMERLTRLRPFQRINHFPGMSEICKKDLLANNLKRMKKILPGEYNFFPLTFCLPDEFRLLSQYCERRKKRDIFIIKPDKNCQGSGIDIVRGIDHVNKYKNVVCQKYITKPLLMENFKLDLRLYVLITSVNPLRVYVYNEGLVRLATIPYKKPSSTNMHEKRMHLTNYAINRSTGDGGPDLLQKGGCKKSFSDLEKLLESRGISCNHLWPAIDAIIVKTILSALPTLRHMFHTCFPIPPAVSPCFEILGFDVLLDSKIKPYLLEVNRSPSLGGSTAMDKELKRNLIKNTLDMVLLTHKQITFINDEQHMKAVRRLTNPNITRHLTAKERILAEYQEKRETRMMGNFRRLYPVDDGRYDECLRDAFSLDPTNKAEFRRNTPPKTNSEIDMITLIKARPTQSD